MKKIGFIGAGNMAGALIRGFLASQRYKPDDIWVADPVDSQVRRLKRAHKVDGTRDNRLLVKQSQTVILAVKPQMMAAVLEEIRSGGQPEEALRLDRGGLPAPAPGDRARRPGPRRPGHAEHARSWWGGRLGGGRGQQGHPDRSEADAQALQGGRRGGVDHRRGSARRRDGTLGQRAGLRLPLRREPDRGRGARRPAAEPRHPARLRDPRRRRGDAGRERAVGARAARHGDLARAARRSRGWARSSSTTSARR